MNIAQHYPAPPPPGQRAGRTLADVAAEIEQRVAAAPVRSRPFPHLVIDDLLPDVVRNALDRYWPDQARLGNSNYAQRGEIQVSRLASGSDGPEQAFWNALRALTTRISRAARARMDRHLAVKFRPLIGPGWRRKLGDIRYDDRDAMLAHYTGMVDLPPHIDHARLVVNGFVYLGDRDALPPEPLRGTMLYRSLGFAWPTNRDIPKALRDQFLREETEVEWRDNRLLAYVNGPVSFHGVPKHDLGDGRRRLLMCGSVLDRDTAARIYDQAIC